MFFLNNDTWENIFSHWRGREAGNPCWVEVATKIKGWPDWESWRAFTAKQLGAEKLQWSIFQFDNPNEEIPAMLIGPYSGWQSQVNDKNLTAFSQLVDSYGAVEMESAQKKCAGIMSGLPFDTEFIAVVRDDLNKLVCIEGHHRALAITLVQRAGINPDFSKAKITVAIAHIPAEQCGIFDAMLKRGTARDNI